MKEHFDDDINSTNATPPAFCGPFGLPPIPRWRRTTCSADATFGRPAAAFQALAAKGPGEWRFPDAGLMSSDGLVLAKLSRQPEGAHVMELQAQGLVGLSIYANRAARVRFGADLAADGVFDRDGRLHLVFEDAAISEADLSAFELQLLDGAL